METQNICPETNGISTTAGQCSECGGLHNWSKPVGRSRAAKARRSELHDALAGEMYRAMPVKGSHQGKWFCGEAGRVR